MSDTSPPTARTTARSLDELPWSDDLLGESFHSAAFHIPGGADAPATLIRTLPDSPSTRSALLWIHGMSDYFFQDHVAEYFVSQGFPFYAIDLHGCGRSWREGQRWHMSTDLSEYFPELTYALELIAATHGSVVPLAHSTGGLIAALWVDHLRREDPQLHARIEGLILNSPWLDMQFSPAMVKVMRPLAAVLGRIAPSLTVKKGGTGTYGKSIAASESGSWNFDTTFKPIEGHNIDIGWLRAIFTAQKVIHSGIVDAAVPVLTLCSSHSYLAKSYSAAADTADTVLDVSHMRKWAPTLSRESQVTPINGALHDVFLSQPHAREAALTTTLAWLESLSDRTK
ncbi:alpha/beta hydrolase [Corynebacterium sp. LK2510]|uniref:alpha/beta hydrolase n=1 Tax=Corynebacterium sp. LK2510 TaxID=3110472 RepID=UPI0034CDDD97